MAAGKYNIVIDQGSDWAEQFRITVDEVPMDLTGYMVRGHLRTSKKSTTIAAEFTGSIVDAADGTFKVELYHTVSSPMEAGIYHYDIELYTAGDISVFRALNGTVTLTQEVTR